MFISELQDARVRECARAAPANIPGLDAYGHLLPC
jgi:hypothetical protein